MIDGLLHYVNDNINWLIRLLILVAFGLYFATQTPLNDITKANLEKACTYGGFTNTDIDRIKSELSKNGYDPSQLDIEVQPSEAMNISSTSYAPRGTIISLEITYNKYPMLDEIFKKLGATGDTKNQVIRYGMSEKP